MFDNTSRPTVRVLWDPMPDVSPDNSKGENDAGTPSTESNCVLLPTKWKKDIEMGWRMDINIDVENTKEDMSETKSEESESESESESDSDTD